LQELTDEQLIARYRENEERAALGVLYKRYAHLVLGCCLDYLKQREDAKDATMDIFAKLTEKLKSHQVENFRPWLFFVSRNHCLDLLRKRIRAHPEEISDHLFVESDETFRLDEEKQLEMLTDAIRELRGEQRQCIRLFYLQGQSYQQVVENTGFTQKQVKSYLQNGRRNLKITLTKWQHERSDQ
jgi:RNA polymerase sigma-70 factor (ECF subfamily)